MIALIDEDEHIRKTTSKCAGLLGAFLEIDEFSTFVSAISSLRNDHWGSLVGKCMAIAELARNCNSGEKLNGMLRNQLLLLMHQALKDERSGVKIGVCRYVCMLTV
jgi:hypothetical protein